ncbi:MAG: hypothetical protein QOI20_2564, partial [Acidimicrobiaceae bacterium]|nr:hypothetical protein [Acidimicrobiaceae bacterium]
YVPVQDPVVVIRSPRVVTDNSVPKQSMVSDSFHETLILRARKRLQVIACLVSTFWTSANVGEVYAHDREQQWLK